MNTEQTSKNILHNTYFAQKEPIKVKIFETFECSSQNLSNSLCQFWNDNSIDSSPNFVSLFSFMEDNSFVLLSSNSTYSTQKKPIKVKLFETFVSKFVKFLMSVFKQQVDSSPNFVSLFNFMKDNSSVLF